MLVDSHCHLDRLDLAPYGGDLDAALAAARDCGVSGMLCVGIDLPHMPDVLAIAERHKDVYASVGVHPIQDTPQEVAVEDLLRLAEHPRVVAIGESGLDYYYQADSAPQQRENFARHLAAAKQCDKPIIVHSRGAKEDTLDLITGADLSRAGVLHCFTEDWDMAKRALDVNYYISISGIVTFKNADTLREVVRKIPLDRLLIETDSPYLAPVPHRGKSNEPRYVREVAEAVAALKSLPVETLAQITRDNFNRLFLAA